MNKHLAMKTIYMGFQASEINCTSMRGTKSGSIGSHFSKSSSRMLDMKTLVMVVIERIEGNVHLMGCENITFERMSPNTS